MRKQFINIFVFVFLFIGCQSKNSENENSVNMVDTASVIIQPDTLPVFKPDTTQSILNNLFVAEFLVSGAMYRKILIFESDTNVTYKLFNANKHMLIGRELDARNKGVWKINRDILEIEWDGYYEGRWSVSTQYKRKILSKFKIGFENEKPFFVQLLDSVTFAESDPDAPELSYQIPPEIDQNTTPIKFNLGEKNKLNTKYLVADYDPVKSSKSEGAKKNNTCYDQASYDYGYKVAREQLGAGLAADADYLYETFGSGYNFYCFSKGVNQWIADH